MILQQKQVNPIWGWDAPGTKVTVTFAGQTKCAEAGADVGGLDVEAADEIGLAVIAITLTIVAVFAPVGFMPGIIGQFFKAFALAACVSVLFSLVVARLLTPLRMFMAPDGRLLIADHDNHRIRALGGFEIIRDGQPMRFAGFFDPASGGQTSFRAIMIPAAARVRTVITRGRR